jgi:glycosyltransferase involved in cell wall biosynthesis
VGEQVATSLTVLQLLPALDGGGVEQGTLDVAAALVRHGHRSLVLSETGRLVPRLLAEGSEHICWPVGRKSLATLRLVSRLKRLLLLEQVDILHARSRLPAWIAWLAWRVMDPLKRPHFITTVHGLYSVNAYSAVMTKGEQVIAVSESARDYVLDNYPGVAPDRVRVIHRGVDRKIFPEQFCPDEGWLAAWKRQFPALADRYLITLPGRINRRKGVLDFIGIVAALKRRGIPVHGLLVGEVPPGKKRWNEELRAAIEAAGIADSVMFTGFRKDVREIMAVSAAVLSVSQQPEAFGRTVNEALSLGVPVAGYAHGGVGEQLESRFPQGSIAPLDQGAMVERLAGWFESPPSMQGVRPYTLDEMLDKTLSLYQRVIAD